MKNVVQKIIAAGVVIYDNKVLIVQRAADEEILPNLWEFPSGKREPLEESVTTVKREVKEETGIEVEVVSIISVFEFKVEKPDEIRDLTQINFLVKPVATPEVKLSSEHQNFAWVGEDELGNYNLSEEVKAVMKKAFGFHL